MPRTSTPQFDCVPLEPRVGAPVLLRVAAVPATRPIELVARLSSLLHRDEGAIEIAAEVSGDGPGGFVVAETMGVHEAAPPGHLIELTTGVVDTAAVTHRSPVAGRDCDVHEPVDGAVEVEVDEAVGATTGDDDVLDAEVVVAHERPGERAPGDRRPPQTT